MVMILGGSGTANGITSFSSAAAFANDLTINRKAVVNYTPATTDNAAIYVAAANCQGGTGYADFLKVQNISHPGVTNANKTFRLNSTGGIEIINNAYSSNLFTLSDAGYLNLPNHPSFKAARTTGNLSATNTIIFDTIIHNTGSCYSASTGRFTAPIAGKYYICCNIFNTSGTATQSYMRVNGTNVQYCLYYGSGYGNMNMSNILSLNASDYVDVAVTTGTIYAAGAATDCTFCGQFLG